MQLSELARRAETRTRKCARSACRSAAICKERNTPIVLLSWSSQGVSAYNRFARGRLLRVCIAYNNDRKLFRVIQTDTLQRNGMCDDSSMETFTRESHLFLAKDTCASQNSDMSSLFFRNEDLDFFFKHLRLSERIKCLISLLYKLYMMGGESLLSLGYFIEAFIIYNVQYRLRERNLIMKTIINCQTSMLHSIKI